MLTVRVFVSTHVRIVAIATQNDTRLDLGNLEKIYMHFTDQRKKKVKMDLAQ